MYSIVFLGCEKDVASLTDVEKDVATAGKKVLKSLE